ncbi:sphingosine-1-phosphate lyase isoform X3 [Schistocerca gregaria]|uniref:sphingosine-1-phosphate lyase isoform X1 n=1 Tax=Schistocerca gregaria TaxID=7010 RepID=UPI00211E6BDF|nr:sphingosine-1-phosphate lyase isoform X1 [Schistocerca gregaria]XP_049837089.1 sphingosine-1-phosphate lyase isoform X2 [Schistocerca gregaria]XP_049837098.1 sphingosine-1-phosphate lyase isoform X3 [Schistocerca gregaria]
MDPIAKGKLAVETLKSFVNNSLSNKEPWQIVTMTTGAVLATVWFFDFINQDESVPSRLKKTVFRLARKIPAVARRIDSEMSNMRKTFEDEVRHRNEKIDYITNLPESGKNREEILKQVKAYLELGDYDWKKGYVSGTVYFHNPELIELLTEVYGLASYTNPLHPDVFPGVCKMEAEVVRIAANLFHGSPSACGTMTTGGTESILMACKAYRDYAKFERGIKHPEIVLPKTAHPAFDKAALYFGMRIKHVPVDPVTTKVNIRAMKNSISKNTCMLVGSVPNFPYGTMDDIEAIAELGRRYNIPVHVDACLGGFVIVFMQKAGYKLPPFDFSVPGVTSISADTHKYGFAPKGSSVVLYAEPKYRHHQFTVTTDWPGGVYGSPCVSGSRAGGIIAACWATMMYFGLDGYVEATKKIVSTTKKIEEGLRKMKGIFVFGTADTSVVAIGSNDFHIYRLSDAITKRGWNINALQFPPGMHLCVTYMHTAEGVAERFLSDIQEELEKILKEPVKEVGGKFAVYGMSQSVPDRSIVGDFTRCFLDSMYYTPSQPNGTGNSKSVV